MRAALGTAAVLLLAAYALVSVFAAASYFWVPGGTIGLNPGYGADIRSVDPGGPAARAGITPSDRIDLAGTPFDERRYVSGVAATMPVGTVVRVRILRSGVARDVVLTAVAARYGESDRLSLILECAATVLFVAVGGALIVLRPSRATWGFGFYCMIVNPTSPYPFRFESTPAALLAIGFFDIVQNVGVVGLLVFALNFPQRQPVPWRLRLEAWMPALFVVLAAMTLYPDVANLVLARGARAENYVLQIAFGLVWAAALVILMSTYKSAPKAERERLRWVLVGFVVGLTVSYVGNTVSYSTLLPVAPPDWLVNVFVSLNVLLPLTVAHAVVRHRVLDINFVVSRTIVYGGITALLVGMFGLLDWVFSRLLADFRLSILAEAAITIAGAYGFKGVEARTERVVEAVFFRSRRTAKERLDRPAAVLPQATSLEAIDNVLALEAQDALGLLSAALFRECGTGYRRVAAFGWAPGTRDALDDGDVLALTVRAGATSVNLAALPWRADRVPGGAAAPIVAVAVRSLGVVRAIALYGSHRDGQDIDPGELQDLEHLAAAAGVAYDELDSRRLLAENDAHRGEIADLRARLDEYRRYSPRRADAPEPRVESPGV